jgi:hypothetical protein
MTKTTFHTSVIFPNKMSLRQYIDEQFPEKEKEKVLRTIKKWLGKNLNFDRWRLN